MRVFLPIPNVLRTWANVVTLGFLHELPCKNTSNSAAVDKNSDTSVTDSVLSFIM